MKIELVPLDWGVLEPSDGVVLKVDAILLGSRSQIEVPS